MLTVSWVDSLLIVTCPRGPPAVQQVSCLFSAESQGKCSQSAGGPTARLSGLCVWGLGTWDHTVAGIWGLQGVVVEAQWVVRRKPPGNNVQLRCCGTGPGSGGTRRPGEAGLLLPHSPFYGEQREKNQNPIKSRA